MTRTDAQRILDRLVRLHGRWSNTQQQAWIAELEPLHAEWANAAIGDLIRSWRFASNPPFGAFMEHYERHCRRAATELPPIPATDPPAINPAAGRKIALDAAVAASRSEGREPNVDRLRTILGRVGDRHD